MVALEKTIGNQLPPLFGGLTLKQHNFLNHYLKTGNGTEAARIAYGYADDDAGNAIAAAHASRTLRLPKVQMEVKRRLGTSVASAQEVLETLTEHARSDIAQVLDSNGDFDLRRAKRRGKSKLLKKVKIRKQYDKDGNLTETREFELHDAQAALVHLGKVHGLFTDKVEVSSSHDNKDSLINELCERFQLNPAQARAMIAEMSGEVIDITPHDPA
jgi:hypothetical protein